MNNQFMPEEPQSSGELRRALAEAQAEATLNRDRFLRCRADMENFKKRLERQAGVGRPFDPRLHEAVDTISTDEQPDGTVLQESLKGYLLGNDVLRPARVVVATAPRPDAQRAER